MGSQRSIRRSDGGNGTRVSATWLLTIFCAALVLRLLMIAWSGSQLYSADTTAMSKNYFARGYALSAGFGYVVPNEDLLALKNRVEAGGFKATPETVGPPPDGLHPESVRPPGMALLIAGAHALLGIRADLPIQLFGAVLDSLAAVLVCWTVASFWSTRVGIASALTYALFLPQAYYAAGARMPAGVLAFFIIASLAFVLVATRSKSARAYIWFAASGLALGVGSYLRPDYLLMPIAMLPFVWAVTGKLRKSVLGVVLMLAVAHATLLPWAYRNYTAFDRWIFTSTSVGGTLVNGLGEFDNVWGFAGTDMDRAREAGEQGFRSPWAPEASEYFKGVFVEAVKEHPGAFVVSILKRLPLALMPVCDFGFDNPLQTKTFAQIRKTGQDRYDVLLENPWYIVQAYWDNLLIGGFSLFCLLCSAYMLIREWRHYGLILLMMSPHLYSIGAHILTHMEPRYLLPSMFSLFIGFGYVVVELLDSKKRKREPALQHTRQRA